MATEPPKNFEITIDAAGRVTVHTKGAKGNACHDWADLMVEILGREQSRVLTGEFYESNEQRARNTVDAKNRYT
jgi:hypothetical protein